MSGRADIRIGSVDAFVEWEPVLRCLFDDRAVYEPGTIGFCDRDGAPLELRRSFTIDSDPDEMGHFLAQAGFLHIEGVFGQAEMAAVSRDLDDGSPARWISIRTSSRSAVTRTGSRSTCARSGQVPRRSTAPSRPRSIPAMFREEYGRVFDGDQRWQGLPVPAGDLFAWDAGSTYVKAPPFFDGMTPEPAPIKDLSGARVLAVLGDSVTTDHISPAGSIAVDGPAGKYLIAQGVQPKDFNSYGARRGNHEVMVRGTFANIRLRNQLVPGVEGGVTVHLPDGARTTIYEAAERYRAEGVPLIVLAGKEYGSGSSRDWAAKGTQLLGVRAVIAESFERIHRSNLLGMGVLALQFKDGQNCASLGLTGRETFAVSGLAAGLKPRQMLKVRAAENGKVTEFEVLARIDTPEDVEYLRHGGVLPYVLRELLRS